MRVWRVSVLVVLSFGGLLLSSCATTPPTPIPPPGTSESDIPDALELYQYWAFVHASFREREQYRDSGWVLDYFGDADTNILALASEIDGVYHVAFRGTAGGEFLAWGNRFIYAARPRRPRYHAPESTFRAHNGFLLRYEAVRQDVLSRVLAHRDMPIVIAGMSAGGAVALLAYLDLLDIAPDLDIRLVSFSPPRVLTARTAASLRSDGLDETRMLTFRHGNELVPALPPRFLGFSHVGTFVQTGRPRGPITLSFSDHWPGIRDELLEILAESGLTRTEIGF